MSTGTETRGRRNTRRLQDIDLHVGARIRERRIMLGLTQWQLAELMGTSNKQIHKYETGVNRITVGRLYQSAQALAVEIGYFFDGLAGERAVRSTPQQRLLLELIRRFAAIPDERLRGALCDLVRALALSRPRA